MRLFLIYLLLPISSLRAQTTPGEIAPRAPSLIILPGTSSVPTGNPSVILTLTHTLVPATAPKLIVPKTSVIQAPAAKIIVAARPLTEAEASPEEFPAQEDIKRLAKSLDPRSEGATDDAKGAALDSEFDGKLAPEAAAWDSLAPGLAGTALAPSLPRVESAARSLFARLLPRLYRRVETRSAYDRGENPATGHSWTPGQGHLIEISPVSADSRGEVPTAFGLPGRTFVQQKIEQLLGYAHEYAHVLFDSLTGRRENHSAHSAYAAMTEGFAVTVEQALIGRMLERAPELGLTPRDAMDLAAVARAREEWLAALDTHYSEGVITWRKVFAQGGEAGLLAHLAGLSARRMIQVSRADPAYQLSLGDPQLLSAYLGGQDSPEARGLRAFARAAKGEELSPEEAREASLAVEQAGAEGWRRLFDRTLMADKRISEPRSAPASGNWWGKEAEAPASVLPVFALARLSPAGAAELARYLAQALAAPAGAARLFERAGPNEKLNSLVSGAEGLPWQDADRRAWMEGLTRWLLGAG